MGLMYRLRELKNFRKTGIPSDADGPAWERPYETLRKKWVQVPTTAAGSERTTRLLELSDEALVAEWEKARMDRFWSGQHHVCTARGATDLCGSCGIESEGSAAHLRNHGA